LDIIPTQPAVFDVQSFDGVLHEGTDRCGDFGTPTTFSQQNYF
jgi:hypothetical protein